MIQLHQAFHQESGSYANPPISSVSINKCNVVFTDRDSKQAIHLKNTQQAKQFVSWLLTISADN